jgi:glycosyltransferase involved in cell wall biosynthesis
MSSPGRLLVVTESLGVGGTESHLIRLLPLLAARGWKVATFCTTERGARAEQLESAGVEVFAARRHAARKGSLLRNPVHAAIVFTKLYRLARRWRPDIVHFYLPGPYLIGAPVAMAASTPIKVMSRRSLSRYQLNRPTVARIERFLHPRMDAVTGNSRAVVDELIGEGVAEAKVKLIYNGVDVVGPIQDRSEARRALGLDDGALVGVIIANLIPYKGHRDLIKGLSHVASHLPSGWRVLFAGRDHGHRSELESLAASRGIEANIVFLAERSDIPRLLAAADFSLLTSKEEGFSNVILESMAAGLPMVATDVGGNSEAVIDEVTGFVVPASDPKAIGAAVWRLAHDPDLRRRLGEAGRQRVAEEFSMERCVDAYAELYRNLLAARRRDSS